MVRDRSGKSPTRSLLRFARFFFAIARRCSGMKRVEQSMGSVGDVVYRAIESGFICPRRARRAAQFAHELQRRRTNLVIGGRRLEIRQGFDIATHEIVEV
jgi:hypothetical protein